MFLIPDGKSSFYQWDVGQRLLCSAVEVGTEVHFAAANDGRCIAEVSLAYEDDGAIYVNIPDVILRYYGDMTIYVYPRADDTEGHTAYVQRFYIKARKKPADYIYVEEDRLPTWTALDARVTALEEGGIGAAGASAYDLAVANGFEGTEVEWLASLVGHQGDTGATGATGPAGADGYTPIRGVDYWTDADQESIIQQVIAALGTPVFGTVDENNVITLTGELADGTYTLKYENADGNVVEIGTIEVGASGDGSIAIPLNLQLGKIDSSTGAITTAENYAYSDLVAIEEGKTYTLTWTDCAMSAKVCYYDASGNFLSCTADTITGDGEPGVLASGSATVPLIDGASYFRFRVYLNYYNSGYADSFTYAQNGMALTYEKAA